MARRKKKLPEPRRVNKIVLTITDLELGEADVRVAVDTPIDDVTNEELSTAESLACAALMAMNKIATQKPAGV